MSFIRNLLRDVARRVLGNEYVSPTQYHAALSRVEELEKNPRTVYAVHRDTFNKQVVQRLEQPVINSQSTKEQVAYLLGIQRALTVMDKELVSG
jgi:hypothetical protein